MKPRPDGMLSDDKIPHDSEIFDYIRELHEYLWKFVRAVKPGASGRLNDHVDSAVRALLEPAADVANTDRGSCRVCGGPRTMIRGRYPDAPKRDVCPTCLADRMDLIRETSDRDYGRAFKSSPLPTPPSDGGKEGA